MAMQTNDRLVRHPNKSQVAQQAQVAVIIHSEVNRSVEFQVVHHVTLRPRAFVLYLKEVTHSFRAKMKSKLVSLSGVTTWCLSNNLGTSYSALAPAHIIVE